MRKLAELDALVVDDHAPSRAIVAGALRAAGLTAVREAGDGAQALAMLGERRADLALVDQAMPEMDGIAFIAAARAADPALRMLMITGFGDARIAERARAAGAGGVILKPVTPAALLAAVERLFAD